MSEASTVSSGTSVPAWADLHFHSLEQALNGAKSKPFHALRRKAFEQFKRQGLPTPKLEDWKYTNLATLQKAELTLAKCDAPFSAAELAALKLPELSNLRVVFVDGFFRPELSSTQFPAGLKVESLRQLTSGESGSLASLGMMLRYDAHPFSSLSTAFLSDGLALTVGRNQTVSEPLQVIFVSSGKNVARYPRVLIRGGENSEVSVVEYHCGTDASSGFSCALTEIHAEPSARVRHSKIQRESLSTTHVGLIGIGMDRDAVVHTGTITFGGALVRNEVHAALGGEHLNCHLLGLTVLKGTQHVDNSTVLDHQVPHGESRENYKGIYDEKSQGVFSGTIIVQPGAQKTNAFQSNQTLLLSGEASIETRPQLKIWADDVKCTHGATVGQLDDEALFYLRARGIGEAEARRMLVLAFGADILAEIGIEPLKEHVKMLIDSKLNS